MKLNELYASVTNRIIKELEAGAVPWVKPWHNGNRGGLMPYNAATNRAYSGINIPILWHAAEVRGYPTHGWLTYKQAKARAAHVRKGEKGTTVVFTKKLTVGEEDEERRVSMLRTYTVFNVAQVDGLERQPTPDIVAIPNPDINHFVASTEADIRIGGDTAAYIPSMDFITMPPVEAFRGQEHYHATVLHELGHWSGAKHRLDRDLSGRFKTRSYAAEELIAELTAAFLCAHLGVTGELRHAGYIQHWIALLRDDDRAIFTAASRASQAANYLRSFSEGVDEDE